MSTFKGNGVDLVGMFQMKNNLLGLLISTIQGIPLSQFRELFNAYCDEEILPVWYFASSSALRELLYEHQDILEIRGYHSSYYVFVSEPVPPEFEDHRRIVLENEKKSKVRGIPFVGPLREQCFLVDMDMFVGSRIDFIDVPIKIEDMKLE